MTSYSEKLRDPRWQKKRLEIMDRDHFACVECADEAKTKTVHHRKYITGRNPWEYPAFLLQTLCCDCHDDKHLEQRHLSEAVKCFQAQLSTLEVSRLHRAMMFKGPAHDALMKIVKGEA
jgi:hypothetical protein